METFIHESKLRDISLCDKLIEYHRQDVNYKQRGSVGFGENPKEKVSTDVYVYPGTSNPMIQQYLHELMNILQEYFDRYKMPNGFIVDLNSGWNIQHYAPGEGFYSWHCERSIAMDRQRALVFMTYLNDVTDGGETEWYYQDVKVKAEKGKTVIWPTDFTHTHRGIPSPTQHKFIATGWFTFLDHLNYQAFFKRTIDELQKENDELRAKLLKK